MGFLNNTTVTVDAILTKKGRELLAQGTQAFNITKFALADDEVDYRLWDVTHPNGSDYYGSVIESMPLLEAFPDESHVMRYKLVTLPKSTQKMPILFGGPSINFRNGAGGGMGSSPHTVAPSTSNGSDSSYTFILKDRTAVHMEKGILAGQAGLGATTPFYLGDDDVTNTLTWVAKTVIIKVRSVDVEKATTLVIVGNDTGATTSITISNYVTVASIQSLASSTGQTN